MEAPFPRGPTHPVTEEGKALHWACERVLASWLPVNTLEPLTIGQFLNQPCPENGVIITEEMAWAGGVYLETIWDRVWHHPELLQIEKQLSMHNWIPEMNGRTDTMWRSPHGTRLVIWDLKFGYMPKVAFKNWQLISYALGAVTEQTETVELVLVQPRGVSASRPVKTWQMPIAEFWTYAQVLIESATEARGVNPRTAAGGHCYKCRAAADCATLRASGMLAITTGLAGVDVRASEAEIAHELELLDRAKDLVRARLDAMEALAIARIQGGKPIPGYGYGKGLANRSWTASDPQIVAMGAMWGVDVEQRKPCTPNQAEGRGLPRNIIDQFTERAELGARLTRTDRNAAREIFQK